MDGFIKLHRKILEWEWYDDENTFKLFLHLILIANHKDKKYRGKIIKKGQIMTGREKLAESTNLTVQQIRTSLKKLESTNEITIEASRKGTIITITNWSAYQGDNQQTNQQVTNNQPTSNQQVTTNKKDKKDKKDKNNNICKEDRAKEFEQHMLQFKDKCKSEQTLKDFIDYWTESGPNDKKLKFEKQGSFDHSRRLARWISQDYRGHEAKAQQVTLDEHNNYGGIL